MRLPTAGGGIDIEQRKQMADTFLEKASACLGCGACEAVCPQSIPIIESLAKAARVLELNRRKRCGD